MSKQYALVGGQGSGFHDTTDFIIRATLTRYTDLANNSDKFRRFISISCAPHANLYWFTQTGRWTPQTAVGDFSGGTVRDGAWLSQRALTRAGYRMDRAHENLVDERRKDYAVEGLTQTYTDLSPTWVNFIRRMPNVKLLQEQGAPVNNLGSNATGPYTPAPMKTTATNTTGPINMNASPVPQAMMHGDFTLRLTTLERRIEGGVDPFDLMSEVGTLRKNMNERCEQLVAEMDDLKGLQAKLIDLNATVLGLI